MISTVNVIMNNNGIHPLLGRNVCAGINIVKYMGNDETNDPLTGSANI